ncbi:MAG: glutaredoxin 3 [Rhodospirillaceae bacterium]|jgi:glutaredoxin 3|nr:glutaredoxin 3 [Rhodospirillaceae bacterium]
MAKVEIYTTMMCPFCFRALKLLKSKGVDFTEIDVTFHPGLRRKMTDRADGRRSVPQIFIDGEGIGGSDELADLDASGELDAKLEAAA